MAKSTSSTGNGGNSDTSTAVNGLRVSVEGSDLVIRIAMNKTPQPSASGKSLVVASSRGNVTTGVIVNGKHVKIGLNAYIEA